MYGAAVPESTDISREAAERWYRDVVGDPLTWIMILAVVLRAAVMIRGGGSFEDPDNYLPMARSLASGEGFSFKGRPTAYRPPLYPVMLVPAIMLGAWAPWGLALLHLGLGAGTVWMTAVALTDWGRVVNGPVKATMTGGSGSLRFD